LGAVLGEQFAGNAAEGREVPDGHEPREVDADVPGPGQRREVGRVGGGRRRRDTAYRPG
jgi:hypothetical protein